MKTLRVWMLSVVLLTAWSAVSCEKEEEVVPPSFSEHLILGKWIFPVDSTLLWSGRSMVLVKRPSPVITIDSITPMRWVCEGDQFTAMREDSNRVWKFQFNVIGVTDTTLTIEGAYGYTNGVNGSQWSSSGVVGHSWNLSTTLVRDSNEYLVSDEWFF